VSSDSFPVASTWSSEPGGRRGSDCTRDQFIHRKRLAAHFA
jgi:hypothetical protein